MSAIFDALPGLDTPVGAISRSLAEMWHQSEVQGRPAPGSADVTASQVNFVLHLGFNTTPDDALVQFRTAVRFSQRYPSRVVVLCPRQRDEGGTDIRAKVYGECFLGKSKGDTRCCEFVILGYSWNMRQFLEAQLSVCLSTDLPLYYYAHRFASGRGIADYPYLLTRSMRVLIDSANAPPDALSQPLPRPEALRDLAYSRLLHVRQSIGQFLSRYPVAAIADGLGAVKVLSGTERPAEARVLSRWLAGRVAACGAAGARFEAEVPPDAQPGLLAVEFVYANAKSFSWRADLDKGQASIAANFGSGRTALAAAVRLLSPEETLSDAMFF